MRAEKLLESLREMQEDIDRRLRLQAWHQRELQTEDLSPARRALLQKDQKRLQRQIASAYQNHAFRLKRIDRLLNRLPDRTEREALRLHYLSQMRIEDAAELLCYSERHYLRIRQKALRHLEGLLK